MSKVTEGCEVSLLFPDGKDTYQVLNQKNHHDFKVITLDSLLGRAIHGKRAGECIRFHNSIGNLVEVKIIRISEP